MGYIVSFSLFFLDLLRYVSAVTAIGVGPTGDHISLSEGFSKTGTPTTAPTATARTNLNGLRMVEGNMGGIPGHWFPTIVKNCKSQCSLKSHHTNVLSR